MLRFQTPGTSRRFPREKRQAQHVGHASRQPWPTPHCRSVGKRDAGILHTQSKEVTNCVKKNVDTDKVQHSNCYLLAKGTHLEYPSKMRPPPHQSPHQNLIFCYNQWSNDGEKIFVPLTMNSKNGVETFADKNSPSMVYNPGVVRHSLLKIESSAAYNRKNNHGQNRKRSCVRFSRGLDHGRYGSTPRSWSVWFGCSTLISSILPPRNKAWSVSITPKRYGTQYAQYQIRLFWWNFSYVGLLHTKRPPW